MMSLLHRKKENAPLFITASWRDSKGSSRDKSFHILVMHSVSFLHFLIICYFQIHSKNVSLRLGSEGGCEGSKGAMFRVRCIEPVCCGLATKLSVVSHSPKKETKKPREECGSNMRLLRNRDQLPKPLA
jgi:hypothetical protein